MTIQYKTKGVCSQQMNVKIEDGVVQKVEIVGGCHATARGWPAWWRGWRAEDAIQKIQGIRCGYKATSCPDQLSKALQIAWQRKQNGNNEGRPSLTAPPRGVLDPIHEYGGESAYGNAILSRMSD